jgi:phosphotransferase family enzyme
MSNDDVSLIGGNMSAVVRRGGFVHRTSGPWTPTIHRLLNHLAAHGLDWVPTPGGLDELGREIVTFIPGTVLHDPMPAWAWDDAIMVEVATRLAVMHDATTSYDDPDASWQLPGHEPREVVCHNDFVPYNMVFNAGHRMVGVIDWDTASPGPRVWDLAYLAYRLVPLSAPGNPDSLDSSLAERRRRLNLLCHAYGHGETPERVARAAVERLLDLAEFTQRRAADGATHVAAHVDLYREAATWLIATELADATG